MSSDEQHLPLPSSRLGYLFKHAQARMTELTTQALAPLGIDGRELGVLLVLAGHEPQSQQQAATRLGIDRTSMVTVLDTLEDKGLVSRHPHAEDRRRNVVGLTRNGDGILRRAIKASDAAERTLLGPLSETSAQQLRDALRSIIEPTFEQDPAAEQNKPR